MQPIAPKDRPKLIAVAMAIVVALAFVVRNLIGIQTNAQPSEAEPVAATPAPPGDAVRPEDQLSAEAGPAAAEGGTTSEGASDIGAVERLPILDPFRPLERVEIVLTPPAAPNQPVAESVPAPVVRTLPPVQPITAIDLTAPTAAASCQPLRPAAPEAGRAAAPSAPGEASMTSRPAPTQPEVRLVGTVRQAPTALAVFRGSEQAVYIRPQEVIAKWRVVRIEDGQVRLRRRNTRQIVRVGERLPTAP